ncbi:MAG: hypothetical protein AB7N76_26475 [Planctomycetota bacterium]
MPNALVRLLLFVSSYFPLTVIIFFIYFDTKRAVAVTSLSVGVVGVLLLLVYFLGVAPRIEGRRLTGIVKLTRKDSETISYLVSYIVPFLAVPTDGWEKQLALAIFVLVLALLYVNSSLIHINPMLSIFGFRVYEVTLPEDQAIALLTRRRVVRTDELHVIEISENVFLEKKRRKADASQARPSQ